MVCIYFKYCPQSNTFFIIFFLLQPSDSFQKSIKFNLDWRLFHSSLVFFLQNYFDQKRERERKENAKAFPMTVPFCILAEILFLNDTPINPKEQQQQQQQQQQSIIDKGVCAKPCKNVSWWDKNTYCTNLWDKVLIRGINHEELFFMLLLLILIEVL